MREPTFGERYGIILVMLVYVAMLLALVAVYGWPVLSLVPWE